jgi:hypothetical protein
MNQQLSQALRLHLALRSGLFDGREDCLRRGW